MINITKQTFWSVLLKVWTEIQMWGLDHLQSGSIKKESELKSFHRDVKDFLQGEKTNSEELLGNLALNFNFNHDFI